MMCFKNTQLEHLFDFALFRHAHRVFSIHKNRRKVNRRGGKLIIGSYTHTLIDALSAKVTEHADPEQVVADLTAALINPPEELFDVIALIIQAHKEGQK